MSRPNYIGLSHVCIIVDNLMESIFYYNRILSAQPQQYIPHWKGNAFFKEDLSIVFMSIPGTSFTLELLEYHFSKKSPDSVLFHANDISELRHVTLKVRNIDDTFAYLRRQRDINLVSGPSECRAYYIGTPVKTADAEMLGTVRLFYMIDKYGLCWAFEQNYIDMGQ